MNKCILLVRVSTQKQDFTEQENEIYALAKSHGYADECIIPICEKESGVKLDADERSGLKRMRELIENDKSINCVYAWECSRIARWLKVSFSVVDYLTRKKIQLIIKNPYVELLNKDGSINSGMELLFVVLAQQAQSEARDMKERFTRARNAMKRDKLYIGGPVPFGYIVDEKKRFVIDEKCVPLIQEMYIMRCDGWSYNQMAKELIARGYKQFYAVTLRSYFKNRIWCGDYYPRIISEEQHLKATETTEKLKSWDSTRQKTYYYASRLVFCGACGHVMTANLRVKLYRCLNCFDHTYNVEVIDSVCWYISKLLYSGEMLKDYSSSIKDYKAKEKIMIDKISTSEKEIDMFTSRLEELDEQYYVEGKITKEKKLSLEKKITDKILEIRSDIERYNKSLLSIREMLAQNKQEKRYIKSADLDSLSDIEKQTICRKMIEKIVPYKENGKNILHVYPKVAFDEPIIVKVGIRSKKVECDSVLFQDNWYQPHCKKGIKGLPKEA